MIAPSMMGFELKKFQDHLRQMIEDDNVKEKIFIVDTLKKFTDVMHKANSSDFMKLARELTVNGGTLILLAHTNKNKDKSGKLVPGGTSDVLDDTDCAFTLEVISSNSNSRQVLLSNIKSRGAVANELSFSYSIKLGHDYYKRLQSVTIEDKAVLAKAKKAKKIADDHEADRLAINAIEDTIRGGFNHKTLLLDKASADHGLSKRSVSRVLDKYIGESLAHGDLWYETFGEKNAKSYHLLADKKKS